MCHLEDKSWSPFINYLLSLTQYETLINEIQISILLAVCLLHFHFPFLFPFFIIYIFNLFLLVLFIVYYFYFKMPIPWFHSVLFLTSLYYAWNLKFPFFFNNILFNMLEDFCHDQPRLPKGAVSCLVNLLWFLAVISDCQQLKSLSSHILQNT